jgi:hypothetical protein
VNRTVQVKLGKAVKNQKYDLAIGAIGYERRARYAVNSLTPQSDAKFALEFDDRQEHDFNKNRNAFNKAGFKIVPAQSGALREVILEWWRQLPRTADVWVDISSLTRPLIATICYELFSRATTDDSRINATFVYSHACFSPPPPDYGPIVHKGAVIPEFAGWSDDPATPCSAVFGIGYEVGLALGALEDLEPAEAWAFRPTGHAKAYDDEIDANNKDFLADLSEDHLVTYDVGAPLELIAKLESVVYGRLQTQRVVIIPFGLKLFALAAFLVALQHLPRVNVWRVSGGKFVKPINRIPSGRISYLDVIFDGTFLGAGARESVR